MKLILVVLAVPSDTVESFSVHFVASSVSIVNVYLPGLRAGRVSPFLRTISAIAVV